MPDFVQQLLEACRGVTQDATGDHVTQDTGSQSSKDRITDLLEGVGLRPINEMKTEPSAGDEILNHLNALWNGTTVLHVAAEKGCSNLIPILMLYGADPAVRNQSGHPPYSVAKIKDVRDSFRRFMSQFPAAYDYERSLIPSPLTEEMERERSKKEADKKREKKKARKQREKVSIGHCCSC
jgi:hypothetical protein